MTGDFGPVVSGMPFMVNDIASECHPVARQEYAVAPLGFEADADNRADDIDLATIAAAMLGFGNRQISDGKTPSKI